MSFRSSFDRSHKRRKAWQPNRGHAARRLQFEIFEDRRLLSFSAAVNYPIDASVDAIATADFNNDGKLDLVTCADAATGSFSVLLGNGAGGFGAAQRYVVGSLLSSIAVADFNNDTRPDMVVSDNVGFSILIGNGDGTFQSAVHTWGAGEMATVGDFDNDSNIDVVVIWTDPDWATHTRVYRGNGQGGFVAGPDAWYTGVGGLAAVDLNNDGILDVATGEGIASLGDGTGGFQFDWDPPAPLSGGAIATGDFTGEGNADVIVAASSVAVLRGKGDGGFDPPVHHSANGTAHTGVATADFNADGKLDAVVSNGDTGTVSLMLGNGDGTLRYAGAFATGTYATGVVVGDFNRDGRPDVAVSTSRNLSVLLNDGDWGQVNPNPLPGDYNGNGTVDAADYVVWRKTQGTTVTPSSGADGNGDGMVDQDDYGVWRSRFGQMASPPAAGSGVSVAGEIEAQAAEATGVGEQTNLGRPQVVKTRSAVEVRRASAKQPAMMVRESAFVELLARPTTSLVQIHLAVRSPLGARTAHETSRRDDAVLMWVSPDSKQAGNDWQSGNMLEDKEANNAGDAFFESIDEVFSLLTSG
jgi:FG-GAP-like repeat